MRLTSLAVILLAWLPVQPERGSATFDLASYAAELDRLRAGLLAASTAEEARALAETVPDRWWVATDSQVTVVDTSWVDTAVGAADTTAWPGVKADIAERLATMRVTATDERPVRGRSAGEALEAVLARPEFKRAATSRWAEQLRKRVGEWLVSLLDRFTPSGVSGRVAAMIFAWTVSLAALAALVLWLVSHLLRRADATRIDLGTTPPSSESARQWAIRAIESARGGDLREAVRYAYRASISKLEEQGAWTSDRSRTPREYVSLLEDTDPRYQAFTDLTRRFEQVWYGRRHATPDDAQVVWAHLERLGCVTPSERAIWSS